MKIIIAGIGNIGAGLAGRLLKEVEIGRASCRERV